MPSASRYSRAADSGGAALPVLRSVEQFAEAHPPPAVEALELKLLDRIEIGRTGVDLDPGQQHRDFHVLQIGRLPHHVLAREIVSALLQRLNQSMGAGISE